jgi:hypothetical protein
MMKYSFSPSQVAFYANALKETYYDPAGQWPEDAYDISDTVTNEFTSQPTEGKRLGVIDGHPAWVNIPSPTHDELIAMVVEEKQRLINAANDFMNNKQWPGKAALGRLKDDELKKYNEWLDYLDALESVDAENTPDISWPEPPER